MLVFPWTVSRFFCEQLLKKVVVHTWVYLHTHFIAFYFSDAKNWNTPYRSDAVSWCGLWGDDMFVL